MARVGHITTVLSTAAVHDTVADMDDFYNLNLPPSGDRVPVTMNTVYAAFNTLTKIKLKLQRQVIQGKCHVPSCVNTF